MGSGKSSVGKALASKLGLAFCDLDDEIEFQSGRDIAFIFKNYGEFFFRKLERKILKEQLHKTNSILSLGGGTPCFYNNIDLINKQSTSFYLQSTPTILQSRLEKEKEARPIISSLDNNELLAFIEHNLVERKKYYSKAKHVIINTDLAQSVNQIITLSHENIH